MRKQAGMFAGLGPVKASGQCDPGKTVRSHYTYTIIQLRALHTASTVLIFLHQRTMFPQAYTTNQLHTASTASSGLTFLHERQCPHNHIPLFDCVHCVHWVLCPLCDCIHWIHWLDLFAPKTMSPPPYITIPLCVLHMASTVLIFLHQRTMFPQPYTTNQLHTASTASSGLTFLQ